ncbi:hypothetical protein [uncultured Eubacterium sp.]|uniref:hypothetical protein n=1 Tax=uncultured Eubacterium sp. TaxID=165185 RepID=UPI002595A1EC|nr:hypothetical protein [uncultured Eubacterium sp.]
MRTLTTEPLYDEYVQLVTALRDLRKQTEEINRRDIMRDFYVFPAVPSNSIKQPVINPNDIKLVNFNKNKGTTVIKWKDGSITKVKAQTKMGDTYNPEMGTAMCICKKALGNKGNFNEVFKKWLPKED